MNAATRRSRRGLAICLLIGATLAGARDSDDEGPGAREALAGAKAGEQAAGEEWRIRERARSAARERLDRAEARLRESRKTSNAVQAEADLALARTAARRTQDELEVAEAAWADWIRESSAATERCLALEAKRSNSPDAGAALLRHRATAAWDLLEWECLGMSRAEKLLEERNAACAAASEADAPAAAVLLDSARRDLVTRRARVEACRASAAALRADFLGGLKPLDPGDWDLGKARHLLVRAGFGGTPQEVSALHALGLHRAVEHLVDYQRQPAPELPFEASPPAPPADPLEGGLRLPGVQARVSEARRAGWDGDIAPLRRWWLRRMLETARPLQEKLALFWHGHFATQGSVVASPYLIHQQNRLFREHAAGSFEGLLHGVVHDPGMLRFLDNHANVKGRANENLARELMELFAMGAGPGHTEKDVREAARALSGQTFDPRTGAFRFSARDHDEGQKIIFDRCGPWTGGDLVDLILQQPSTPRFIARKLLEFFCSPEPTDDSVRRLASVLRTCRYEIAPALRNLFLSEEFYGAGARGSQIKSPVQLVVGALRELGIRRIADPGALDAALQRMGQTLFEPPDVKGWRHDRSWINTERILVRYNTIADLVKNAAPVDGRRGVDVVALVETGGCRTAQQIVECLARTLFPVPASAAKIETLVGFLDGIPPAEAWKARHDELNARLQTLLVLMTSLPDYQLH